MVVIKYNLDRQRLNYLCIGLSFPRPSWTLDTPIKCLGARSKLQVCVWSLFSRTLGTSLRRKWDKTLCTVPLFVCFRVFLVYTLALVESLNSTLHLYAVRRTWLRQEAGKCEAMEGPSWWTRILQNCFVREENTILVFDPWGGAMQNNRSWIFVVLSPNISRVSVWWLVAV